MNVPIILMHSRGNSLTMNDLCNYNDITSDVSSELNNSINVAKKEKIFKFMMLIDPGLLILYTG